jgi:gliding motility-associated-like protein
LWSNGATQQNLLNITAGQYNVIVSDANGCQIMDTFNLIQPDSLVASFIISDTLGCKPMNTQFINTSIGNYTSAVWSVGNGDVIVAQNSVSYTMNQYGCFDLTLTITSANGCVASSTENSAFCVIPGPTASFYSTTEEIDFYSGLLQLVNNSIGNDNQYQWYFSDGYQSNAENPTHFFPEQTNSIYDIMLIAIDSNGCIDTAIQQYVQQETNVMTVPNSFTAGDDGVNDTFKPVFSLPDLISSYSLEIYNRWGELIFSTNNQYDAWDGKYKGKKCQSGAYTWKIKYTDYLNTTKDAHGHVVLLW